MTDRARAWTLFRLLTRRISIVAVGPLLLAVALGGGFLHQSVHREIEALVEEELEEARAWLSGSDDYVEDLEVVVERLRGQHPGDAIAWRLLGPDATELRRCGQVELFDADQAGASAGCFGDARFGDSVPLPGDLRLEVILDAGPFCARLQRYWILALVITAVGTGLALLASRLVAGRISTLVRSVADSVGADEDDRASPRRPVPAELAEVAAQLRGKFRAVRAEADRIRVFTGALAHELRSPVQNMIGQTELALGGQTDSSSYRDILASQLEELGAFADAIDNFLTICTLGADVGGQHETFDLAEELRMRLLRETERARRRHIALQMCASGDARMTGNREHVLRGIRNVVANAVDWTPRDGHVDVGVEAVDGWVTVTVDDTGPGIPESERERIFEPFVQGATRSQVRTGFGLGLAIAAASTDAHAGRVEVGSSPSGGARFVLKFRRSPQPQTA